MILLSGSPSSGKTSLLFQFAFNSVVDDNSVTVFICNRRKLETKPPFLSKGIHPSSNLFNRIQIKNCQQRYRSPRGKELAIVRTLALCRNAVNHANETGLCVLFLHIYKRDGSTLLTLSKVMELGHLFSRIIAT